MDWYKNLDATPRLMIGFGLCLALTLGLSILAIGSLAAANDRITVLYEKDIRGVLLAYEMGNNQAAIAKKCRDAILHLDDGARVSQDEQELLSEFAKMHANLDQAHEYFYTVEGKALLEDIATHLPAYEQAYHVVLPYLDAKDARGATAALDRTLKASDPLVAALTNVKRNKRQRMEEKYEVNTQQYGHARALILGSAALALLLGAVLSVVIARGFAVPLGEAVRVLEAMAGGDLTVSLEVETRDEVGRMARAMNGTIARLRSTLTQVTQSASSATSASQELSAAADTLAGGAQEQASSLEKTSASIEQIASTIRQNAEGARTAKDLAAASREAAQGGQGVVVSAIKAMEEINDASSKISNIISTIDEIAFQTNLLAVNAAVEAARAGEQGRGFAVVATEVRSLAQRSAGAAKEIKHLIQDSLAKVEKGSGLVNQSGQTLHGIVGSVKKVTDVMSEISSAIEEQTVGIDQVNTAVMQIDQVTQANASQTEQLSSTARALAEQSEHLMKLVSIFELGQDALQESTMTRRPRPQALPKPRTVAKAQKQARPHGAKAVPVALLTQAGSRHATGSAASFEEL